MDITPLVQSYHPDITKIEKVLEKYKIDADDRNRQDTVKLSSNYDYELYQELKQRVNVFLKDQNFSRTWSISRWIKNILSLIVYCIVSYLYLFHPSVPICLIFGIMGISWAGNVLHEGAHNSISSYPVINRIGAYFLLPWGCPDMWHIDHNIKHHGHTNTDLDGDFVAPSDYTIGRYAKKFTHHIWYYFQWLHIPISFPFVIYGKGIGASIMMLLGIYPGSEKHVFGPLIHIISFYIFFIQVGITHGFIYPNISFMTYSIIFMVVSQVNHITENNVHASNENDFCINQIESSTNYKSSFFTDLFCFGLDRQIEHHLFPSLSYDKLDAIRPLVEDFCKEKNIKYYYTDSFYQAFRNYISHLAECGDIPK